jgi:plasmid stabilization system protein ParE
MTYGLTSLANSELETAVQYYEEAECGLGAKFLDEIEATIKRILAMPEAWKPLSKRTRRCLLHRFPFAVIYQIRSGEILIVSVMDLRRDPESIQTLL